MCANRHNMSVVGWLVFNGTFSTKKLYHAIGKLCVKAVVMG